MMSLAPYWEDREAGVELHLGDAREVARGIADASVDLCFCDPVYERLEDYRWLAEECRRVLRPGGNLLVWQGVKWLPETLPALSGHLTYRWTLGLSHLNACVGTIKGDVYSHWTPLLWFAANGGRPRRRVRDFVDVPLSGGAAHQWQKSAPAVLGWVDAFTSVGDTVWDPFTGGATVPSVCLQLGRRCIASEIDPETAARARDRLRNTPRSLPFDAPPPPLALAGLEIEP
jgi:SAM-dependent methyltransferase